MDIPEANQTLQLVRDEFLVRFYRWAKESSEEEYNAGFPSLSRIKNLSVLRFLNFVATLDETESTLLRSALLKRFHQRAVELLDDFPSAYEEAILKRYSLAPEVSPSQISPSARGLRKGDFREIVLKKLNPLLGDPIDSPTDRETWSYQTGVGCWVLSTTVDTGGRRNVGYAHSIRARESVYLHEGISILSWMGISSQTDWMHLSQAETPEAAECLKNVCQHFSIAVPKLLEDLSHSVTEPEVRTWRELVTVKGHRSSGFTIVVIDSPELRRAFAGKATWEVPTSIIPERLRKIGSHFTIVQDPAFSRESTDPLALSPTYRHVRVEFNQNSQG
jgi:hypothetical protein